MMEQAPDYPIYEPPKRILHTWCDDCKGEIYIGEEYYKRDDVTLCLDCMRQCIREAE